MTGPLVQACDDARGTYIFWCPACKSHHGFATKLKPAWKFNGDAMNPTFKPSLRIKGGPKRDTLCHLYVRDGKINYCGDCPHGLAGRTIRMVPVDEV